MSAGVESAARLRRISTALREGRPIDPADAEPHAANLDAILSGIEPRQALGLAAPGRGQADALRALALADRDEALEELREHFGGDVETPNSETIWDIFEALEAFGLHQSRRPETEIDELLRRVLHGSGGRVLSRRTICDLLR